MKCPVRDRPRRRQEGVPPSSPRRDGLLRRGFSAGTAHLAGLVIGPCTLCGRPVRYADGMERGEAVAHFDCGRRADRAALGCVQRDLLMMRAVHFLALLKRLGAPTALDLDLVFAEEDPVRSLLGPIRETLPWLEARRRRLATGFCDTLERRLSAIEKGAAS